MKDPRFKCAQNLAGKYVVWGLYGVEIVGDTEEACYAQWLPLVVEIDRLLGRTATQDELKNPPKHHDERSGREIDADKKVRESELSDAAPPADSPEVARRKWLEERVRQEREETMTPAERMLAAAIRKEDEVKAAKGASEAEAVRRAPHAALLNEARMRSILSVWDMALTQAEVEAVQHQAALFDKTLDATQYKARRDKLDGQVAARLGQTEAEALALYESQKQQRARFLRQPVVEETKADKPHGFDRPPEAAESTTGRAMVRIFFDGRSTVVPQWFATENASDPAGMIDYARRHGSVEDAKLIEGDAPIGAWS